MREVSLQLHMVTDWSHQEEPLCIVLALARITVTDRSTSLLASVWAALVTFRAERGMSLQTEIRFSFVQ